MGRGPLDHLPVVGETAPGASASSPVLLGGGGDALGLATARPEAEADKSEARALGKRAVSLVALTAEVEPAPADTEAVPPPLLLQRRVAVPKRLQPRSSGKRPAEVPSLAPLKALKVNPSSTAHGVVEVQAGIQRGAASVGADPKELVAQGEAAEAALTQAGEGAPTPREAEACESDGPRRPWSLRPLRPRPPRTSEAEATEAGVSRTTEAAVAEARAPGTTEAGAAEADVSAAKLAAQEVEMKEAETSVPPSVQGPPPLRESAREVEVHSISSDDTSRGKEGADAEAASTMEQPASTSGEGSSALVWELEAWSLRKSIFLRRERDIWDQLQRQKDLLARANELLSTRSIEVEDLRLRWLEKEVSRVAEASVAVQAALEAEIGEHTVPRSATRALHTGIKHALAVITSHYIGVDLKAISDGYVLPVDDEEADEEVAKLMKAAEGLGTALAKLFEEEVVPPMPSADAGDPEP
ncbi:uncharacterized protein [Miscanthus floridulus]|uniref:uncharacterized protein n=1 Tax=Miscanthus floridulus TaxID=154761 RepID=UPI003459496E